jgi:hypothetical protein
MQRDIITWCPTSKTEVRLTIETRYNKPIIGDIVRGKAVQCNLNRECPRDRDFCWLRSEQIKARV